MRHVFVVLAGMLLLAPGSRAIADSAFVVALAGSIEVSVVFTEDEIRIMRAHYESHGGKKSNGKAQKGLPPGIAKNLARGKALPPGIARQALPYDLRRDLPPVRDGYERIIVDGKILLVEIATQVIHDVLTDIVLN